MARKKAKKPRRRYRRPIKFEWKQADRRPAWRYVRERLVDPDECAANSFLVVGRVAPGVNLTTCCPKGARRGPDKRCQKRGRYTPAIRQALAHQVARFKARHPEIWAKLMAAKPTKAGLRTYRYARVPSPVPGYPPRPARRRLVLSAMEVRSERAAKAYLSMGVPGYKTTVEGLAGLFL